MKDAPHRRPIADLALSAELEDLRRDRDVWRLIACLSCGLCCGIMIWVVAS